MRLNKYLADAGIASRRAADRLIQAGAIKINGQIVKQLGTQVDPSRDKITVRGESARLDKKSVYLMLNKPAGVVSACQPTSVEPHTVTDLIDLPERLFPVGRLDKDTTGLLLLTNDGELTLRLTHPSFECEKEYEAILEGEITPSAIRKLEAGVVLDSQKTSPVKVRQLQNSVIRLVLHEGKNRHIRRICRKVGYPVLKLKRLRVKTLELGKLPLGKWRFLTPAEVEHLKINS